ncbi:MAG: glycosyltransferase [Candidatus Krumholzibacteriia bacterium]
MSVIVPARDEEEHIGRCLESLLSLEYPRHRVEIVVVDNGSRDRTAEIARGTGVRVLELPQGNIGAVRNHGVRGTTGAFLAFIDADCIAPDGWLNTAIALLSEDEGLGAVGGSCKAEESATWVERAWDSGRSGSCTYVHGLATGSMIISRRRFEEVGGFNEALTAGEDYDLSARLRAMGLRLLLHPTCSVIHLGWPKNLGGVFRRELWHGSHQLELAHGLMTRTMISVHLFAVTLLVGLFWVFASGFSSAFPLLLLSVPLSLPAAAAWARSTAIAPRSARARRMATLYPIFWSYYLGRSFGLLGNYGSLFGRWIRRSR